MASIAYHGVVENGVVVLKAGSKIPEGTLVRVEPLSLATMPPESTCPQDDPVFRMSELAVETGIADLATNVDHYLYGHPKASHG